MTKAPLRLIIHLLIFASIGLFFLFMPASIAKAAAAGYGEWYGYGYGYALRQHKAETRRQALADQDKHDHDVIFAAASRALDSLGEVRVSAMTFAATWILSRTGRTVPLLGLRIVEESCLARAVYFEARSEPQRGQLAVATVILNRVKASNYPSSICGVVYQGSSRLNGCQFSFACDGKPDLPRPGRAWETAIAVAAVALMDDHEMQDERLLIVSTATHYHADYVEPRWSKSLNRLTKIGHHIFYSQG